MAFVALTAAQTDADSPLDQPLFDTIRTDLDYLNDTVNQFLSSGQNAIVDDFIATAVDTVVWELGGLTNPSISAAGAHSVNLSSGGGAGSSGMRGQTTKCRIKLNTDHSFTMEWRAKRTAGTNPSYMMGLQDVAVTQGQNAATTHSDLIAFIRGTNNNDIKFQTGKAAALTTSADLGTWDAWRTFKIQVSIIGAATSVTGWFDGTQVSGTPYTTNCPTTVILAPSFDTYEGGAGNSFSVDYVSLLWLARPLSA